MTPLLLLLLALCLGCTGLQRPDFRPSRATATPLFDAALAPAPNLRQRALSVDFTFVTSEPKQSADGRRHFWLVALLTPPPGGHLYWKHAGETGLPTQVQFFVPSGFAVSAPQYPGPSRLPAESGRVGYGYTGPIAIMAEVIAPVLHVHAVGTMRSAPLARLEVQASWLSCDELCIREQTRAHIEWPLSANEKTVSDRELAAWRRKLPVEPPSPAWQAQRVSPSELVVRVPPEWTIVEVFPELDLGPDERDLTALRTPHLKPNLSAYHSNHLPSSVLVKAQNADVGQYVRLRVHDALEL